MIYPNCTNGGQQSGQTSRSSFPTTPPGGSQSPYFYNWPSSPPAPVRSYCQARVGNRSSPKNSCSCWKTSSTPCVNPCARSCPCVKCPNTPPSNTRVPQKPHFYSPCQPNLFQNRNYCQPTGGHYCNGFWRTTSAPSVNPCKIKSFSSIRPVPTNPYPEKKPHFCGKSTCVNSSRVKGRTVLSATSVENKPCPCEKPKEISSPNVQIPTPSPTEKVVPENTVDKRNSGCKCASVKDVQEQKDFFPNDSNFKEVCDSLIGKCKELKEKNGGNQRNKIYYCISPSVYVTVENNIPTENTCGDKEPEIEPKASPKPEKKVKKGVPCARPNNPCIKIKSPRKLDICLQKCHTYCFDGDTEEIQSVNSQSSKQLSSKSTKKSSSRKLNKDKKSSTGISSSKGLVAESSSKKLAKSKGNFAAKSSSSTRKSSKEKRSVSSKDFDQDLYQKLADGVPDCCCRCKSKIELKEEQVSPKLDCCGRVIEEIAEPSLPTLNLKHSVEIPDCCIKSVHSVGEQYITPEPSIKDLVEVNCSGDSVSPIIEIEPRQQYISSELSEIILDTDQDDISDDCIEPKENIEEANPEPSVEILDKNVINCCESFIESDCCGNTFEKSNTIGDIPNCCADFINSSASKLGNKEVLLDCCGSTFDKSNTKGDIPNCCADFIDSSASKLGNKEVLLDCCGSTFDTGVSKFTQDIAVEPFNIVNKTSEQDSQINENNRLSEDKQEITPELSEKIIQTEDTDYCGNIVDKESEQDNEKLPQINENNRLSEDKQEITPELSDKLIQTEEEECFGDIVDRESEQNNNKFFNQEQVLLDRKLAHQEDISKINMAIKKESPLKNRQITNGASKKNNGKNNIKPAKTKPVPAELSFNDNKNSKNGKSKLKEKLPPEENGSSVDDSKNSKPKPNGNNIIKHIAKKEPVANHKMEKENINKGCCGPNSKHLDKRNDCKECDDKTKGDSKSKRAECDNENCKKRPKGPNKWKTCCEEPQCPLKDPTTSAFKFIMQARQCCNKKECQLAAKICDLYEPKYLTVGDTKVPDTWGDYQYHYYGTDAATAYEVNPIAMEVKQSEEIKKEEKKKDEEKSVTVVEKSSEEQDVLPPTILLFDDISSDDPIRDSMNMDPDDEPRKERRASSVSWNIPTASAFKGNSFPSRLGSSSDRHTSDSDVDGPVPEGLEEEDDLEPEDPDAQEVIAAATAEANKFRQTPQQNVVPPTFGDLMKRKSEKEPKEITSRKGSQEMLFKSQLDTAVNSAESKHRTSCCLAIRNKFKMKKKRGPRTSDDSSARNSFESERRRTIGNPVKEKNQQINSILNSM